MPLQILVGQLLIGRTEGLKAREVAAFLSGWTSALDVLRRFDLVLPNAGQEVRHALEQALDALTEAQEIVLEPNQDEQVTG